MALPAVGQIPVAEIVETDADRKPRVVTSGDCFIRGGTILTVTNGVIRDGSILVRRGKIEAIGTNLKAPEGIPVIDAVGKFITPGIIDAHSHIAEEETNEGTDSVTPEVRIRDVLDPNSLSIYQKLASGFTCSLVLHGSANAIGGQSVVIKHKWKRPAAELPVSDAPRIVKFALGENVKQSFSFPGQDTRFPKTRMGVEAVYRRAFGEARRYMDAWERYEKTGRNNPSTASPRRDLRLEALADILRGKIWVHCHSYRADEMLMMLRLSKEFGFKLAALQHALEAYKIAPEIRAAGVGVSTFSDDWAYKVEAFDAIPHNAAICSRAGIVTSVNTDSSEGVSTLNLDAAKTMKYGGLSETEALKLITINPAIQLGVDRRTGSLEPGKDADIGIWDGHPLSAYSRCAMTLVEGTVYFQRRDAFGLDSQATTAAPATVRAADADHLTLPAASRCYALVGAAIHPVSGPDIPEGTVVIRDGKIAASGRRIAIPKDAVVVRAKGLHVYPGMVDAGSVLGLKEIEQVAATLDTSEAGLFQPDLLALTAVNPASEHLAITRSEGITSTLSRPDSGGFGGGGNLIAGQSAIIALTGWTPDEMKIRSPAALHISWPEGPNSFPEFIRRLLPPEELKRRQDVAKDQIRRLREELDRGKRYAATKLAAPERALYDARLEALIPYVTGKAPVVIRVNTVAGIKKSLELGEQLGLKIIIEGGQSAWRLTEVLAKRQIPVICSLPVIDITAGGKGENYDPYDAPFALPALLNRGGVKFCFGSGEAAVAKNIRFCGSQAAAFGLPKKDALRAITLGAAEILGVSSELGSIDIGKRADLIVTNGDPMEVTTGLRYLFIGGKPIPLESRHTRLFQQYRNRK
jgi:imidazolonepropionase-like amidohydrolase